MKKLLIFVLAFSVTLTLQAEDAFSTLEERMSGKEFKETGLGKLTDAELSALNDWIRRHSVATLDNAAAKPPAGNAKTAAAEDIRGFENRPKDAQAYEDIHGIIDGTFDGWKGNGTLFKLTNGMVWQQVEVSNFHIEPIENAEIIIKSGILGSWRLSPVGYRSDVRVRRVK